MMKDDQIVTTKLFVPRDASVPMFLELKGTTEATGYLSDGTLYILETNRYGIDVIRNMATRSKNQFRLLDDGGYVETENMPRDCVVCRKTIKMAIFKNTGVCSELCHKRLMGG